MTTTAPAAANIALSSVQEAEQSLLAIDLRTLKAPERDLVKTAREASIVASKALRKATR